ncbi:uncharacterized protein LOC135498348 [Lineus longissimus]|uniref:uncharacterized protein LOC135498348 n=1 Tax=Lineus longissimus TaxID=88925 RepID=UPI00315CA6C0
MGTFSSPTLLILCVTIVAVNTGRPSTVQRVCTYKYENADCEGRDLSHSKKTRAACRDACTKRPDCKSFQHRGYDCWLKNRVCSKKQLTFRGHPGFAQYTKHCSDEAIDDKLLHYQ